MYLSHQWAQYRAYGCWGRSVVVLWLVVALACRRAFGLRRGFVVFHRLACNAQGIIISQVQALAVWHCACDGGTLQCSWNPSL